jgi:hypothetical protein
MLLIFLALHINAKTRLHDDWSDCFKSGCEDPDLTLVDNEDCQAAYDDIDWTDINLEFEPDDAAAFLANCVKTFCSEACREAFCAVHADPTNNDKRDTAKAKCNPTNGSISRTRSSLLLGILLALVTGFGFN